jgi:hypothetical protein
MHIYKFLLSISLLIDSRFDCLNVFQYFDMKINSIFLIIAVLILSSCTPAVYYQVYKATPVNNVTLKDSVFYYEDENCKVLYNLWHESGNIGFTLYNKAEKNIYINLDECFFIVNGKAYDYYKDRVYISTKGSNVLRTSEVATASDIGKFRDLDLVQKNSISYVNPVAVATGTAGSKLMFYNEEKIICVPSHTSKTINEYSINDKLIRHCDLYCNPTSYAIRTISFTKSESPIVFSNRIEYRVGQLGNPTKLENEFYISEITNYPEVEMIEHRIDRFCGQREFTLTKYLKNSAYDKFYIKYLW